MITTSRDNSREGWAERFEEMRARGDDRLFDNDGHSLTKWDDQEWEWQSEET